MVTAALLIGVLAQSPSRYGAVTDLGPRAKPTLVKPGPAGSSWKDPAFGSPVWRVTDANTRSDRTGVSFRTPSATHQNEWSAQSSYFYIVSTDGTVVPFAFDPFSGAASRLPPLIFYIEPQFSRISDSLIYGTVSSGTLHTIDQYDFATGKYTQILDLETLAGGLAGTYIGGITSSAGTTERIVTFFGGASQDQHH